MSPGVTPKGVNISWITNLLVLGFHGGFIKDFFLEADSPIITSLISKIYCNPGQNPVL